MMQLYSAAEQIFRTEIKGEEKKIWENVTSSDLLPKTFWISWTWTRGSKVEP